MTDQGGEQRKEIAAFDEIVGRAELAGALAAHRVGMGRINDDGDTGSVTVGRVAVNDAQEVLRLGHAVAKQDALLAR